MFGRKFCFFTFDTACAISETAMCGPAGLRVFVDIPAKAALRITLLSLFSNLAPAFLSSNSTISNNESSISSFVINGRVPYLSMVISVLSYVWVSILIAWPSAILSAYVPVSPFTTLSE